MTRIFAPGAFDHGNRGDAALVLAYVEWLRATWPDCRITITSFRPEEDQVALGVPAIHMVTRPRSTFTRAVGGALRRIPRIGAALQSLFHISYILVILALLGGWAFIHRVAPRAARKILPTHVRAVVEEVEAADVAMAVPGGYLIAQRWTDTFWLYHLPTFALVKMLGRTLILGPSSFGPFVGPSRLFARWVWERFDRVHLRERKSELIAAQLGVEMSKVLRSFDIGFLMRPNLPDPRPVCYETLSTLRADGSLLLGLSVRMHHFPGSAAPGDAFREYLHGYSDAVAQLCETDARAHPVVIAQTAEDVDVSRHLSMLLDERGVTHTVVLDDLDPRALMTIFELLHVMAGTRMHACILSLCVSVPVVGVAYEPKTPGILETVGLEEWSLDITEVASGRLAEAIRLRWFGRETGALAAARAVGIARAGLQVDSVRLRELVASAGERSEPGT